MTSNEAPTEKKSPPKGHNVESRSSEYFVGPSIKSEFERTYGYSKADSEETKKYMDANNLLQWNSAQDGIPGIEEVQVVNKALVMKVIEQDAWPKNTLAIENLLIQADIHQLPHTYQLKLTNALKKMDVAQEYTPPHIREMPTPKEDEGYEMTPDNRLTFMTLRDKKLVEIVIETESWAKNSIALENLLRAANKLGLESKYIEKVQEALNMSPKSFYIHPEQRFHTYKSGSDKKEDSLDRELARDLETQQALLEYDRALVTQVIETGHWHQSKNALGSLLLEAKRLKLGPELLKKVEDAFASMPEMPAVQYIRPSEDHTPTKNYLDGVLAPERIFAPEIVIADAKLTVLVFRLDSLPESLTALAPYISSVRKLKEGTMLQFNAQKPGEEITQEVTAEFKEKLEVKVLEKADSIIPDKLDGLAKCFDRLDHSRTFGVMREKVLAKIDLALPDNAKDLAKALRYMNQKKFSIKMQEFAIVKAEKLNLKEEFENALGSKVNIIEEIEREKAEQAAKFTKPVKPGHHVDRMHSQYSVDSALKNGMKMTGNGGMIGYFGDSHETREFLEKHSLTLWKSSLSATIPGTKALENLDQKHIAVLVRMVKDTKEWPASGSFKAIENLLIQVMHLLPNELGELLAILPALWKQDIGNMVSLFARAKNIGSKKADETGKVKYLSTEIDDLAGKSKAAMEELLSFTISNMPESEEKKELVDAMEKEIPSLNEALDDDADSVLDGSEFDANLRTPEARSETSNNDLADVVRKLSFDDKKDEGIDSPKPPTSPARSTKSTDNSNGWAKPPSQDVQELLRSITEIKTGDMVAVNINDLLKLVSAAGNSSTSKHQSVISDDMTGSNSSQSHRDSISSCGERRIDIGGDGNDLYNQQTVEIF